MLSVCIVAMEIMQEEAATFGMEINWSKTKNQAVGTQHCPSVVQVAGNELVDCFTYLGVQVSNNGSSEQEVRQRTAITRDCSQALQNNIWCSNIQLETKICLLNVYVFQSCFMEPRHGHSPACLRRSSMHVSSGV